MRPIGLTDSEGAIATDQISITVAAGTALADVVNPIRDDNVSVIDVGANSVTTPFFAPVVSLGPLPSPPTGAPRT